MKDIMKYIIHDEYSIGDKMFDESRLVIKYIMPRPIGLKGDELDEYLKINNNTMDLAVREILYGDIINELTNLYQHIDINQEHLLDKLNNIIIMIEGL